MASVLTQRFEELDLATLPARAQQELKLRQQRVTHRLGKMQRDLTRQRQLLVGKLYDESLDALYTRANSALTVASQMLERAPDVAPVTAGVGRLDAVQLRIASRQNRLHAPPIAQYDDLNVKQVNEALDSLGAHDILKVERYERDHKNRVTVLREVERLMTR